MASPRIFPGGDWGEEIVHNPSYLSYIISNLSMYGEHSWYWTYAVDLIITLINGCSGIG